MDATNSWYETPKDIIAIPLDAITGEETKDKSKLSLFYYLKGSDVT